MLTVDALFGTRRRPLAALANRPARIVAIGIALALMVLRVSGPSPKPVVRSSGFHNHQGVDKCGNIQNQTVNGVVISWQKRLLDLWNGSPFYNYRVYIGGAQGAWVGRISTTTFVNQVRAIYFGMMPLWDDLQPRCTSNHDLISTNTTNHRAKA